MKSGISAVSTGVPTFGGDQSTVAKSTSVSQSVTVPTTQSITQYSEYYKITQGSVQSQSPTTPTSPTKYEVKGHEPKALYFTSQQKSIPYSQYQTYATTMGMTNSLWIQGTNSWTQYAAVPQGAGLSMIATSPVGGNAYFYEIYPDGSTDINNYYFYPTSLISFFADEIGRHILLFIIDNQPSNAVIIDVAGYQPIAPVYGVSSITLASYWLSGYEVYVDGNYMATDGLNEPMDGTVTITVPGDMYHTIAVSSPEFSYSNYKYFKSNWAYTLSI
jgi:hypothetical protein